jgi:hypothetical protein
LVIRAFVDPERSGGTGGTRLHDLEAMLHRLLDAYDSRVLVDYTEAARRLSIPEKWLRERINSLPHRKLGKFVRFAEADLEAIAQMYYVAPASEGGARHSTAVQGALLTELRPSPHSRRRRI